jgi:hypothetical protein
MSISGINRGALGFYGSFGPKSRARSMNGGGNRPLYGE